MKLLKSLLNLYEEEKDAIEKSIERLAQYKKAAAADAKLADTEEDFERGNKRFRGINLATKKQFALAMKKIKAKGGAENK